MKLLADPRCLFDYLMIQAPREHSISSPLLSSNPQNGYINLIKMQPQKQSPSQNKSQQFPLCINKKEARLVCLNSQCKQYPFYCTSCEGNECQIIHQHGSKLISMGFKEYIKRVLKDKNIKPQLQSALAKYEQCLEKLKKDVQQFIEKELMEIEEIREAAEKIEEDQELVIKKLRTKQYEGLSGGQLDKIWQRLADSAMSDNDRQTVEFLRVKQQEIEEISNNFQNVNRMEMEAGDEQSEDGGKEKEHNLEQGAGLGVYSFQAKKSEP